LQCLRFPRPGVSFVLVKLWNWLRRGRRKKAADTRVVRRRRRPMAALGLGVPPPPLALMTGQQQVRPVDWLDGFPTHPGHGLEVQTVVSIYREAEAGYPTRQCDLFEDIIENDGHLRSVIEARTLAVAGKPFSILPGGDSPVDILAADILRESLESTNFEDAITMILGARYFGFSGTEILWRDADGDVVPAWFLTVPFRRFRFAPDDTPLLLNANTSMSGEPLRPGHWIFTRNSGPMTSLTVRQGLMRTGSFFALWKRWGWRDWNIYSEKYGIPLALGRHDPDASEDELEELDAALEDIGEAGQARFSKHAEIEIREATQGGDANALHRAIIQEANAEISKLITGSTLTVETGSAGSFAQARVHESRSFDLVISDAKLVQDRFADAISRPFLFFNGFPRGTRPPQMKIAVSKETDPLTRAQVFKTLHEMGMPLDKEQLREEFQLRAPPDTDDRELVRQGEAQAQ